VLVLPYCDFEWRERREKNRSDDTIGMPAFNLA